MSRKLAILILLAGLPASRLEAQAEKLGIVVEISSPKLRRIIYPGETAIDVAVATAEQLKVQFIGDGRNIEPRPPLNQWELVPMARPQKGKKTPPPPNHLVFSIEEINQAMWLKLRFVTASGSVGQPLRAQWRQPGDSSGYPAASSAGKAFAELFTSKFVDEQSPAVHERLTHIPLASGKWTTSGIQIPLPLPAKRHEGLRNSYFRLFGEWQDHRDHRTEIGDMEVFADGMRKPVKAKHWSYEALAAKWNEVSYQKYAGCKDHLHFLAVYLAQYRHPDGK